MARIAMTYELALAAGKDAASLRARKDGRQAWNEDDYNLCWETFEKLWPAPHPIIPDRRD